MKAIAIALLAIALSGCSTGPQKAASTEDYCRSGPAHLAYLVAERLRDYVKLDEPSAWAVVRASHADVLRAAPTEEAYMRRVVAFVYAHPEIPPALISKAMFKVCLSERVI